VVINGAYFPNEWEFIGYNPEEDIDGKLPDFKHKQHNWLIEHFGDYHHNDNNPRLKEHQKYNGRMKFLLERGYKTLILWEHEVKKHPISEIANRIKEYFYK
jgi:very-short-patch-repair endonuclease